MEFVKKTYKPKDEKVKKLTKYFTELKIVKPANCDLFSKGGKLLTLLFILTGCSAEYHLKQAIKKCPEMAQISVYGIDTIFVRDSVTITDTFVSKTIDTLTIEKDGVKTIVYRNHDVIRIKTVVKADTIRFTKTITLPPQIQYKERISLPQMVGVGLALILALLFLILLITRK
jgi:hypothetical protein